MRCSVGAQRAIWRGPRGADGVECWVGGGQLESGRGHGKQSRLVLIPMSPGSGGVDGRKCCIWLTFTSESVTHAQRASMQSGTGASTYSGAGEVVN